MNKLTHEELTGKIIACAIAVHKSLGPGFLESVYEAAMPVELKHAGLRVESQKLIRIYYREVWSANIGWICWSKT
jgi:GxxExxY protein